MDQYAAPPAPPAAAALLRPGRLAALLVLAGLVAGTLLEPHNPLRAFLSPVLSPSEPPMIADLFFAAALVLVLVDRLRAGLAVAAGLQLGGSLGTPSFSLARLKRLLLARRGEAGLDPWRDDGPLGPFDPPASTGTGPSTPSDERIDDDEDPWR